MGVKSFRTGKGQKRMATEGGIYKGRAESFLSTRRTGLASHAKDIPPTVLPSQFYIKFKWHMYGSQMGSLRVHWVDENDVNYAVSGSDWNNYRLNVDWFSNGSNVGYVKAGQYQTSDSYVYMTATTENITFNGNDGFIHFGAQIGSGYRSDIAIDRIEFHRTSDDSVFARIGEDGDKWLTNSSTRNDYTSNPSEMQAVALGSSSAKWNFDSNTTASSGTGPDDDSGGTGIYYMYAEASSATNRYCSLRSTDLLGEYLL